MAGRVKFNDLVSFSLLDPALVKIKDDYPGAFKPGSTEQTHRSGLGTVPGANGQQDIQQTAQGLQVRIAATHAGIITRNNGFYLPDKMRKGSTTFVQDFSKPVLLHHDEKNDPVGRVVAAKYLDTSGAVVDNLDSFKRVKKDSFNEKFIKDFVSGSMPFGMQVDAVRNVIRDAVLEDDGYSGLGYIELIANITDPEAIQKLLDGRYLTGSVGASTDSAVCSVCRADWTDDGPCDHKPGAVYDGVKCFMIAGDLVYDEYSFVNKPADRQSKVIEYNINGIQDSIEMADECSGRIYEVNLGFPQYDSSLEEEALMKTKQADSNATQVQDSVTDTSAETTVENNTSTAVEAGDNQDVQDNVNEEEVDVEDDTSEVTNSTTPVNDEANTEEDSLFTILDSDDVKLTPEQEEALYEELYKELIDAVKSGELPMETDQLADAKLSTEARKKLPKSAFCGPDRSFPVNDCAHAVAAKRLLGRADLSDSAKSKIMACINRKAKSMDCKTADSVSNNDVVEDNINHARMMHMLLSVLEQDIYYGDEKVLDEKEVTAMKEVLKRMADLVGEDNFKKVVSEFDFTDAVNSEEEQKLLDEIAKHEDTICDLRDRLDANRKEYTELYKDFENLQDQFVESKSILRKEKESRLKVLQDLRDSKVEQRDFTELNDEVLNAELSKISSEVDMVTITDKLGDGMSRVPEGTVESPQTISDNVIENKESFTVEYLEGVRDSYVEILFSRGEIAANDYLQKLRQEGKLPQEDGENI